MKTIIETAGQALEAYQDWTVDEYCDEDSIGTEARPMGDGRFEILWNDVTIAIVAPCGWVDEVVFHDRITTDCADDAWKRYTDLKTEHRSVSGIRLTLERARKLAYRELLMNPPDAAHNTKENRNDN